MFDRASKGRVWWPAEITRFTPDGDEITEKLMLLLQPYTRQESHERKKKFMQRAAEITAATEENPAPPADEAELRDAAGRSVDTVLALLERGFQRKEEDVMEVIARVHDWRVKSGDDFVPFDRELLTEFMRDEPRVERAVLSAFDACCEGAVRKNSEPGHAGMPAQARAS